MDNQPVNSETEKFVQLSKNEKNGKQKKRYENTIPQTVIDRLCL